MLLASRLFIWACVGLDSPGIGPDISVCGPGLTWDWPGPLCLCDWACVRLGSTGIGPGLCVCVAGPVWGCAHLGLARTSVSV